MLAPRPSTGQSEEGENDEGAKTAQEVWGHRVRTMAAVLSLPGPAPSHSRPQEALSHHGFPGPPRVPGTLSHLNLGTLTIQLGGRCYNNACPLLPGCGHLTVLDSLQGLGKWWPRHHHHPRVTGHQCSFTSTTCCSACNLLQLPQLLGAGTDLTPLNCCQSTAPPTSACAGLSGSSPCTATSTTV